MPGCCQVTSIFSSSIESSILVTIVTILTLWSGFSSGSKFYAPAVCSTAVDFRDTQGFGSHESPDFQPFPSWYANRFTSAVQRTKDAIPLRFRSRTGKIPHLFALLLLAVVPVTQAQELLSALAPVSY